MAVHISVNCIFLLLVLAAFLLEHARFGLFGGLTSERRERVANGRTTHSLGLLKNPDSDRREP